MPQQLRPIAAVALLLRESSVYLHALGIHIVLCGVATVSIAQAWVRKERAVVTSKKILYE